MRLGTARGGRAQGAACWLTGAGRRRDVNTPAAPDLDTLSAKDRIELGLLSRAMGEFAVDEGQREQLTTSLDSVLSVTELRQLSLRDLRILSSERRTPSAEGHPCVPWRGAVRAKAHSPIVSRMRVLVLATTLALSGTALAEEPPAAYVPAPAKDIPGYSESRFPCKTYVGWWREDGTIQEVDRKHPEDEDTRTIVKCSDAPRLQSLTLRELSLLRNTIYARYGWAGFRKSWLREHFQKQPWYKPDPKFSTARLSPVDLQNVQLIAQVELSWSYAGLEGARDKLLASAGKWVGDLPSYTDMEGKVVFACAMRDYKDSLRDSSGAPVSWNQFLRDTGKSMDCRLHKKEFEAGLRREVNTPSAPDLGKLRAEDRIELGLISRAMGEFAMDEGQREQLTTSLDSVLSVTELRQLSLRDLRILRNSIFARRGRPFKSKVLQKHFEHMPWYKPDKAYTDARLTENDKRNIELIRAVEEEFGGALKDSDFKVAAPSTVDPDPIPTMYMAA